KAYHVFLPCEDDIPGIRVFVSSAPEKLSHLSGFLGLEEPDEEELVRLQPSDAYYREPVARGDPRVYDHSLDLDGGAALFTGGIRLLGRLKRLLLGGGRRRGSALERLMRHGRRLTGILLARLLLRRARRDRDSLDELVTFML
ncbi:MAG TPA: hypothetical protein VFB30_07595, partial [Spirochaetia bacterium]|nr:hypothetical protein [Spirochaetia bacterium]